MLEALLKPERMIMHIKSLDTQAMIVLQLLILSRIWQAEKHAVKFTQYCSLHQSVVMIEAVSVLKKT